MDDLVIARSLFGTTMAFHIIFASLGVGIPLMILCAELLYQKTKNRDYAVMAKRWTKGIAVLLGVAIPSGTIAGVQLSLLWPGFMEVIGKVMALPFQIEIYAFFVEALFMSIYVYAADRISPAMRILSVTLVALGASASAILITNVHAFEGTPDGFRIENGQVVDVDPWAAFFNPSFFVTAGHVTVSAFMTGAFVLASISAYKMLREKNKRVLEFYRKALMLSLVVGGIFSILTALNGHEAAQLLHEYQPEKLAAAEGLFETQSHAPLAIGGFTDPDTQSVKWAIEIPWLLSFLAGNSFDTVVQGLNDFPKEWWPPLFIHTLFNAMVGIGSFLILLSLIGLVWSKVMKRPAFPRPLMWAIIASGPLSMLAIEFGWIFACTGRQPWVIYRMMKTEDAVTQSENLALLFILFAAIYIVLSIAVVLVLKYYFRRHPVINELDSQETGHSNHFTQ
ncbi:cytochrome ubiquinol oxidase subunit I [Anoxybacillus sp. UARK-01]|uniref:Cytochrome ubiquinol oxidase subunit I n=1 Tax=Anoxybacteroides rupiense TaxID=311460 RepID=A0ABD5ITH2_9BACL|nr:MULTISPECIES: cytochrome ubiquinol oxidase subunit I [Anoxybacillus]MBB3906963.1 cytochrome d ubiquinol oxidase subunit I [Anoxybacillus rupiensis]MBS2771509.1 cytochrome ubiquinol oxidase subunit I [Anoxybacillus rupiensis]MED5051251.1 cytochrome ubiquinol oxidase subunit I [Anoxybacillus rupiensis]OQM45503.1 cytochrome ubiquinol oxidase subunit I [Anoxybacillus sp. UARK-01]